ncbi:MAG: hypothetical protein DRP64_00105 [Verrucomicrobia bacterium]|nr:MAG: hypothetical protein DRP64_00105 [Verrucomicrobiota bacterium]
MTFIKLQSFGGMIPRRGEQVIPDVSATKATNTLLLSGELRALNGNQIVQDLREVAGDIERVFRVVSDAGIFDWVTFDDKSVDFLKGPLVNDAFDRYYWTSEIDSPRMNTRQNILNGDPGWLLGVPQPANPAPPADQFTVTPDGSGSADLQVTRAYTYTYVTAYGEEGMPIDAVVATGDQDDVWELAGMVDPATLPDAAERNITSIHIYRTITSVTGSVDYHFVDEIPSSQTTYSDTAATNDVSGNHLIESETWAEPPPGLIGIAAHPNGFLIGFDGRDLYFSEPYRPHAWPAGYVLSTQDYIKGLGIYGTSVAVCTAGFPYIASGIRPDGITLIKAQTPDPCLSTRRGVVSMPFGVYYPSDNGLMLISQGGFINATKKLITKIEWQRDYSPSQIRAVRWQSQYVGFYEFNAGFMFAPDEPVAAFVELDSVWEHQAIQTDNFTGAVILLKDKVVYEWNPAFGFPVQYEWKSKEFITPKPVNFSACKFELDGAVIVTEEEIADFTTFNLQRFGVIVNDPPPDDPPTDARYPLNPMNFGPLVGVRKIETLPAFIPLPPILPENRNPFHRSPLYATWIYGTDGGGTVIDNLTFNMYADNELVHSVVITDEDMYRLPDGYKSKMWHFEFLGNVNLKSFKVAETGKELGKL